MDSVNNNVHFYCPSKKSSIVTTTIKTLSNNWKAAQHYPSPDNLNKTCHTDDFNQQSSLLIYHESPSGRGDLSIIALTLAFGKSLSIFPQ